MQGHKVDHRCIFGESLDGARAARDTWGNLRVQEEPGYLTPPSPKTVLQDRGDVYDVNYNVYYNVYHDDDV